jgi:hypothetical protein
MAELTIESFYPDNRVECLKDLPLEDGTYDVIERESILNIFEIKNHRIIYHHKYNANMKLRLISWIFEYLTAEDGSQICNVWRQPQGTLERDLYTSTHFDLYPEHHKKRLEHAEKSKIKYETFINNLDTL